MSTETGRPDEQEWAQALEQHYWISERWACYCGWFPSPLGQQPSVAFWLHVVDEIAPLIDREREAAKAEGVAAVAGPVLALADEAKARQGAFPSHSHYEAWVAHEADLRAAIPAEAAEALARVKAEAKAEERERIAQAIEALPTYYVRGAGGGWFHAAVRTHEAARIAREAQQDGGDRG